MMYDKENQVNMSFFITKELFKEFKYVVTTRHGLFNLSKVLRRLIMYYIRYDLDDILFSRETSKDFLEEFNIKDF